MAYDKWSIPRLPNKLLMQTNPNSVDLKV